MSKNYYEPDLDKFIGKDVPIPNIVTTTIPEHLRYYMNTPAEKLLEKKRLDQCLPKVKEVIFAPPATIVYWTDGSRTVVTCSEEDKFVEETGFALCFLKKCLGNKGSYNNYIRKQLKNAKHYDNRLNKMAKMFKKTLTEIVDAKKRQVETFEPLQAIDPTFLDIE